MLLPDNERSDDLVNFFQTTIALHNDLYQESKYVILKKRVSEANKTVLFLHTLIRHILHFPGSRLLPRPPMAWYDTTAIIYLLTNGLYPLRRSATINTRTIFLFDNVTIFRRI